MKSRNHHIRGILTALTLAATLTLSVAPVFSSGRRQPKAAKTAKTDSRSDNLLSILGPTEVSADRMWAFVASVNPDFSPDIARAFYDIGRRYGIRGDVALCQAVIETGWFRFSGGTAVTPDQHNYCGLGVTSLGVKGHAFESVEEGVTAHMQHLYAYATRLPLPKGERVVDPRFTLVRRGVASSWTDLNRRWAANDHYGESIMALFERLLNDDPPVAPASAEGEPTVLELGIPDEYIQ